MQSDKKPLPWVPCYEVTVGILTAQISKKAYAIPLFSVKVGIKRPTKDGQDADFLVPFIGVYMDAAEGKAEIDYKRSPSPQDWYELGSNVEEYIKKETQIAMDYEWDRRNARHVEKKDTKKKYMGPRTGP